jgi:hypothetical protein
VRAAAHFLQWKGVSEDRDTPAPDDERRTPVDQLLRRSVEGNPAVGRPLSDRARQMQRSAEAYISAGAPPRWMERVVEVDRGIDRERRRLAADYAALRRTHGDDPAAFAERWRAHARRRRFDDLNELIRQHNDWYPIERDMPLDPRTGEYIEFGRPYRRPELDAAWILEQFPDAID